MDLIFEIIIELLVEGSIEVSKSRKIPKYLRYPLIAAISLFFIFIIGIVFFTGIMSLKENIFLGIFLIIAGLIFLIMCVIEFRKAYITKRK